MLSFPVRVRAGDIVSASCDAGGCPGADACVYDYGSGDYACCECGPVKLSHRIVLGLLSAVIQNESRT
jgi:hypothetical protein